MSNQTTPKEPQQRVVRVFISSTFRDMHAERDELVKYIFPELRKKCRERQVEFVAVDLRWGIPDEKRSEILPICLKEIDRCLPHDPYFVGILGERYGSLSETINEDMAKDLPWLGEDKEHSITALEIIHGVLKRPEMKSHAFFYFRDPAHIESIPPEKRKDFTEEDPKRAEKLKGLKEKIRQSGQTVRENYPNPKKLGELVLKDLWNVIDEKFPIEGVPTALERERMDHEAFAVARQKVYIGREAYFKRLNDHIASAGPPLVVLGESGAGKSALIANWAKEYQKKHPKDFMVFHYIGGTADSADYVKILRRIMEEIKTRYDPKEKEVVKERSLSISSKEDEIPTDSEKVVEVFPQWLAKAAARGRFILVLDALNQLEDKDNAPDLKWLPEYFPENIRVILSTLPEEKERDFTAEGAEGAKEQVWRRPHVALKRRGWQTIKVELLKPEERRTLIEEYLARFARRLSQKDTDTIIAAKQTANPLYLKALLDELRVYGDHETLDKRINHYLAAQTVDDLYEKVLERLEKDYGRDREGLVCEVMSFIWASRRGLSETELLELLGKDKEPMPRAYWSPLYLAAEESLVSRSGFLNFFHDYLRKAVEDRYFHDTEKNCLDAEKKRQKHLQLADYFEKRPLDARKTDELPWQLQKTESWERLKDCITDIPMFIKLMPDATQYELMGYWLAMENRFDMVASYNAALSRWEQTRPSQDRVALIFDRVSRFLVLNARYDGAEMLYRRALAIWEKILEQEHPSMAISLGMAGGLNNLAGLLDNKGFYAKADPFYRNALAIYEKVLGREHPFTATSLNCLAVLLYKKGDYAGAEPLCSRALAIREKVLGQNHPDTATSLNNLAELLHSKGDYAGAETLYRRALAIREKVLGKDCPDTAVSLNNLAGLLHSKRDYAGAESLYRRSLAIKEKMLGNEHPSTARSLNNLAGLLDDKGDYVGAESLYRRALAIREKVLGKEHPDTATSLNDLAFLLHHSKRDYAGAEPLYRRALAIREKVLREEHLDTAISLNNLAGLLDDKRDYAGAEPLYRRALAIRENVLGMEHLHTGTSLNNLAHLLHATNRLGEAESLMRRVVEILLNFTRKTGHQHSHLHTVVENYAGLLHAMGRSAEDIQSSLEKLGKKFGVDLGGAGVQTGAGPSPKLRAVIEQMMRDPSKAQGIFKKLQSEDPALLAELIQFIQQQQR